MQPTQYYIDITPDNLSHCLECRLNISSQEISVIQRPMADLMLEDVDELLRFLNCDERQNYFVSYVFRGGSISPHLSGLIGSVENLRSLFSSGRITTFELREIRSSPEGAGLLAKLFSSFMIQKLCFLSNYQVLDDVKNLAALLPETRIQNLDLSGNHIRSNEIRVLAAILPITMIRSLNFGFNAITCDGAIVLARVLPNTRIRYLSFWGNRIESKGAKALVKALPTTRIKMLNLGFENTIGSRGAKALIEALPMTRIQILNLFSSGIEPEEVIALARVLTMTRIHTLDLGGNYIGFNAANALARVLVESRIRTLRLESNGIGFHAVETLAGVLHKTRIQKLNLSSNNIGDRGVGALAKILPMTGIQDLGIGYNGIGSKGVMALATALPYTRIQVLDIAGNDEIELDSLRALKRSILKSRIKKLKILGSLPSSDEAMDISHEINASGIVLDRNELLYEANEFVLGLRRSQMLCAYLDSLRFQSVLKMFLMGMELGSASSLLLNVSPWSSLESATWAAEPGRIHFFSLPAKAPAQSAQSSAGRENVPGPSR